MVEQDTSGWKSKPDVETLDLQGGRFRICRCKNTVEKDNKIRRIKIRVKCGQEVKKNRSQGETRRKRAKSFHMSGVLQ